MTTRKMLVGSLMGLLLLAGGCGKNKAVKAAEDMAAAVCACKDAECAMKALEKGSAQLAKMTEEKGTESDAKELMKAMSKAQECATKLTK